MRSVTAATTQIIRIEIDERGSILSTSYRQIYLMNNSNIQEVLSKSNFNLNGFIKDDMDIFVVILEGKIKRTWPFNAHVISIAQTIHCASQF